MTESSEQTTPQLIPDGSGGAIVAWTDARGAGGTPDIYSQRISAGGTAAWTANGVAVCTASQSQYDPVVTTDGSGGAIITWSDLRGSEANVYAQRVSNSGSMQWATDGVVVISYTDPQYSPAIVADDSGGAVIAWTDYRTGNQAGHGDVYAQRISSSGTRQWTTDGVAVCTAPGDQGLQRLVGTGDGGAIITWQDGRGQAYSEDIYAQRISPAGSPQWTTNGVAVCDTSHTQYAPDITTDGSGGAIITWEDRRGQDFSVDIYAQRLRSDSTRAWVKNGVLVCGVSGDKRNPRITSDGAGGAELAWEDPRGGSVDIYAQRLSGAGTAVWASDGVGVCTASSSQSRPAIVTDGAEGAIIAWVDSRSGSDDVYAGRVGPQTGTAITSVETPPVTMGSIRLEQNRPNPFNPSTEIRYTVLSRGVVTARIFSVSGKLIRTLLDQSVDPSPRVLRWDGTDQNDRSVASGVYLLRLSQGKASASCRMVLLR